MTDKPNTPSDRLCRMAEQINRNIDSTFGGAVVIIPPDQGGEPIEILILDSQGDPGQFWSIVTHRIQTAIVALDEQRKQGFGVRR